MRIKLLIIFISFLSVLGYSQNIEINKAGSSELYVESLKQAKDYRYKEILSIYDRFIASQPNDVIAQIERCKFIGTADYDAYEDYNPNYEEMMDCIDNLMNQYPTHPEVILYKFDYTWGEDRRELIAKYIDQVESSATKWSYVQRSKFYEIASNYLIEEDDRMSIMYAEKAERLGDTLDLSISIAEAYLRLGEEKKAKEVLMDALYYQSDDAWTLKRKGDLLISFNEIEEATEMFERVMEKDSTLVSNESFYKIFLQTHEVDIARTYIIKDTINDWNKATNIQKLLNHDIEYSSFDTAIISYRRMQELDYYDDFLGIKRMRLFFKAPFELWTWSELTHMFWLIIGFLILFIIPYLWILPIYSAKKFLKIKVIRQQLNVDWNLKHFWLISFVYLFAQALLILVFYYQDFINGYLEVAYEYGTEIIEEVNSTTAKANLFYFTMTFILSALFLNKKRLKFVFNTTFSWGKIIGLSIGFIIVNAIVIKIATSLFVSEETLAVIHSLNSREEIGTILSEYGFTISFFAVAVIAPLYEEIIFRGIILSSVEKHIGFIAANIIQASLFAIVHMNFQLFLFYFVFGMITGYAVKKSQGLLAGYIFHFVNNFLVLISIYILSSLQ